MVEAQCIGPICLVPLEVVASKFFGFSEFLAALALLVLAWTNADVRYRFRVATAPLPIYRITFVMVLVIGTLTLLTDLWRAEGWLVPAGTLISPAQWQALLGALFLATFVLWIWFAFISPPVFGRWNSFRFASVMYSAILKGAPTELPIIAEEFWRSAKSVITHSWKGSELRKAIEEGPGEDRIRKGKLRARTNAHEILLMIGDKKFCRNVVQSCPGTAQQIFIAIADQKKYSVPVEVFAKNITEEAIKNKDSFVYHEIDGYETGYIGHHKPVTKALYGDFEVAEGVRHLFDVHYLERSNWDGQQWEAFNRLVLLCFESYIEGGRFHQHSFVIHRAIGEIGDSVIDAHALDGAKAGDYFNNKPYTKLRAAVDFVEEAVKVLGQLDVETLRFATRRSGDRRDPFKLVAEVMANIVFAASTVKGPSMTSWSVQYNTVWGRFFGLREPNKAESIVHAQLFRELLRELAHMDLGPNYKGARILGMLLNVMGFELSKQSEDKGYAPFHRAVLAWTKKNFAALYEENPEIIEECLPDAISYDVKNLTLVKTYEKGLSREPAQRYLKVKAS